MQMDQYEFMFQRYAKIPGLIETKGLSDQPEPNMACCKIVRGSPKIAEGKIVKNTALPSAFQGSTNFPVSGNWCDCKSYRHVNPYTP